MSEQAKSLNNRQKLEDELRRLREMNGALLSSLEWMVATFGGGYSLGESLGMDAARSRIVRARNMTLAPDEFYEMACKEVGRLAKVNAELLEALARVSRRLRVEVEGGAHPDRASIEEVDGMVRSVLVRALGQ